MIPSAAMQTALSSRRDALETWVDHLLADRGERVTGNWQDVVGDASFRRFYRIHTDTGSYVVMDAPPETENNTQFVALSKLFRSVGVEVPAVIASDLQRGFLLVSDLGDLSYSKVYETADHDAAIASAIDTIIRIARVGDANGVIPPYTVQRFHDELQLFRVWFAEGLLRYPLTKAEGGLLDDVWRRLVECVEGQHKVCVHRDFHSRNLLWGPDRVTRVVDFQDALYGPVLYDLASLLRDCYVRFGEAEISRWRERFRARADDAKLAVEADPARLARQLDLTAMQRQLKAIGIFSRLQLRDHRPSHLIDIDPVLDHLIDVAAAYPEFHAFGEWLARAIRPAARSELTARGIECGR
jgi:N-acetylmuramate 1-kinase